MANVNSLPHDAEAEKTVIAAVLIDPSRMPDLDPDDLYSSRNRALWRSMRRLSDAGSPIEPPAILSDLENHNDLDRAGGHLYLSELIRGHHNGIHIEHYVGKIQRAAKMRNALAHSHATIEAITDGESPGVVRDLVDGSAAALDGAEDDLWSPSTLEGITDPDAGKVQYLIDDLIPRAGVAVIGATYKAGKTLITYRIVFDAVMGRNVFTSFAVPAPVRTVVFQLEMPLREDERRFRRLCIGAGVEPAKLREMVRDGALAIYNRVPLDLSDAESTTRFHRLVRRQDAQLVVIDSLLAATPGVDLNSNSEVRRMFSAAFSPLTSDGRSILILHHRRKGSSTGKYTDDSRNALLGAQAIGAASDAVFALERLTDDAGSGGSFSVRLSMVGAWRPSGLEDVVLKVEDTEDAGTTVQTMSESEQLRRGGVTKKQVAAMKLTELVRERQRVSRAAAIAAVRDDTNISERTIKDGLKYAKENGLVEVVGDAGKAGDLVPGPSLEG